VLIVFAAICHKPFPAHYNNMNLDDVNIMANRLTAFQTLERHTRRTFGLALTTKCSVACGHCINDSRPGGNTEIALAQIDKLCNEIKAFGEFDTVNMTGGEPFDNFDLLNNATRIIASYGLEPTVVTSACWAISDEASRYLLTELYESGLKFLVISRDEFHEQKVPHHFVVHALRNAIQVGISPALTLTTGVGLKGLDDLLKPISEQLGSDKFNQIEIMESNLLRAGRASQLPPEKFGDAGVHDPSPFYCHVGGPILLPNGEFVACCGAELPISSPLRRGNCDLINASDMTRSLKKDPIVRMIRYLGLRRMAELLGPDEFSPTIWSFIYSANPADMCTVCNYLLAEPSRVARLRYYAQNQDINSEMTIIAALLYGDNTALEEKLCV
jgi:MoaA/NifB/PqqE/SkfB family radical SAM enzyme